MPIRIATPADQEILDELLAGAYSRLDPALYPAGQLEIAIPLLSRAQPKLLASGTYYVVEADGRPAACGGWTFEAPGSGNIEPGLAHLRQIATHPDFLRKGLARQLVAHCAQAARSAGATRLRSWATPDAEPLYAGMGFARLGEIGLAMGSGASMRAIDMELDLVNRV